jgi:hypothetical protein
MRRREFISAMLGGAVYRPQMANAQIRPQPAPAQRNPRGWLYSTNAGRGGFRESETGHWTEITPDGKLLGLAQVSENSAYVELVDASRGVWVRLRPTYAEFRQEPATGWSRLYNGRWAPWGDLPPLPDYQIRLIYFVPSDRTPVANYEAKIRVVMQFATEIFRQNLQGRGFRAKDLAFRSEGGVPIVQLVRSQRPAAYYSGKPNYDDARQIGKVWDDIPTTVSLRNRDAGIVFAETFDFGPAPMEWGGAVARAGRISSSSAACVVSAWCLQDMFCATSFAQTRAMMFDETPIPGRLAMGTPGKPNSARSQFIQDGFGSVAHELGHMFGLPHDHRRPECIMRSAARRMRWNFTEPPELVKGAIFSDDATRWLVTSRFLGQDVDFYDDTPPKAVLRIVKTKLDALPPTATVTLEASDDRELRAVLFYDGREDSTIGGRALSGKSMSFTQELNLFPQKSGGVHVEAFVSDIGGNMIIAKAMSDAQWPT